MSFGIGIAKNLFHVVWMWGHLELELGRVVARNPTQACVIEGKR